MDTRIFVVFDFIILIYGVYSVVSTMQMKKTGQPGKWLVGEQPANKITDPDGFIQNMAVKTTVLGIISIVYGVVGIVDDLIYDLGVVKDGMLIAFLVVFLVFCVLLQKAKSKYF